MSTGWSSEWLDFAYMDLSAAEHLLTMRPLPVEIICYHCEQAAEKFLKATLVQFDREPPKTHDLIQLCKLCCEVDTQFEQLADSCIELTPYGVQVRYPSNLELDESDAVCALKECRLVQGFVCQKLGYEPESKDTQSFGQTMKKVKTAVKAVARKGGGLVASPEVNEQYLFGTLSPRQSWISSWTGSMGRP